MAGKLLGAVEGNAVCADCGVGGPTWARYVYMFIYLFLYFSSPIFNPSPFPFPFPFSPLLPPNQHQPRYSCLYGMFRASSEAGNSPFKGPLTYFG